MRLLIVTQKVNKDDPILGFFHRWIIEFAKHCESIVVICLEEGVHELPANVRVLSLGKEKYSIPINPSTPIPNSKFQILFGSLFSRVRYTARFYSYIWSERKNYDAVFVHMNQEYIILAGVLWKILSKKIYMWRNHHAGSCLTDFAAGFCTKVFCTSKFSFTAKYKKTLLMPVGVDLENFKPLENIQRKKGSILFLARISPSKRPDLFIDTLKKLSDDRIDFNASIYGDPIEVDKKYYDMLQEKVVQLGLSDRVSFYKGVPNHKTPVVYSAHDIFVNLSSNGMYDKTIFEAMACGCLILASNDNLRGQINEDHIFNQCDRNELSDKLKKLLEYTSEERRKSVENFRKFIEAYSLKNLGVAIFKQFYQSYEK